MPPTPPNDTSSATPLTPPNDTSSATAPRPATQRRRSEAAAVADMVKDLHNPTILDTARPATGHGQFIVVPAGMRVESIKRYADENLAAPERRTGVAVMVDADSFVAHVNRFKDTHSVVFATIGATPGLLAVLDYHPAGGIAETAPRFGGHRTSYTFPLSPEWKRWTAADDHKMSQIEFAEFLEDRIGDILAPPARAPKTATGAEPANAADALTGVLGGTYATPQKLVELSRGLAVNVDERVKQANSLSSGEIQVQYETEHRTAGGQALKVPSIFLIAIPVFDGGPRYQIAVRLRYRVHGGRITWFYQLYRHDTVFDHAVAEVCDNIREATGLPMFAGSPEA